MNVMSYPFGSVLHVLDKSLPQVRAGYIKHNSEVCLPFWQRLQFSGVNWAMVR